MTPETFLQLTDLLPEPTLLVSGGGTVLAANRATEERLGVSPKAVRGRPLAEAVAEPPDDVAHYLRACCRSRKMVLGSLTLSGKGGQPSACRAEGAVLQPVGEGTEALVLLRLVPKHSAAGQFVALNQRIEELGKEIHRRKRAEEVIRRQEEWLRVTLNSIGDAVIVTDAEGRVASLNPVARSLTGWSAEAAAGRPLTEVFPIFHEVTRQPVENPVAKVIERGGVVGLGNHTLLFSRDGTERPIDDSAAPIKDDKGDILGVALVFRDVTEKRQTEKALRESEQRFRVMADSIPQLAWMARPDGHIYWYNRRWYDYTGTTPEQMEGWGWQSVHDPDVLPKVLERWKASLASGEPFDMVFPLRARDGVFRPFLTRVMPLRGEDGAVLQWFGTNTDISERMQMEEALRQNEGRHRFLAEVSAALVGSLHYPSALRQVADLAVPVLGDFCFIDVLSDDRLERVAWNHVEAAMRELADDVRRFVPPAEAENHPILTVLRTGQPQLVPEVTDQWLQSAATSPEHADFLRKLEPASLLIVPLLAGDRRQGAVTFCYSVSGRRHTAEELRLAEEVARRAALTVENAKLYNQLRDADRKKDEFLAVLAHELRNPLAPLSNALQVMRLTAISGQAAQVRDMMERQVRQMTRLVDDLLDVSRITRGKIDLRRERLDLAEVVLSALETSRPLIEAAHHELAVTPPTKPLYVEGDKTRLAQVLSNLLTNSAKYTPERGHIWLTVEHRGREAQIRVRDSGVGIPAEMLPKIFEMFTQVDRHLGRSQGGLGIGLTLVRSLVEMHGGSIQARSSGPGQGSEFVVRLPLAAEEPESLVGKGDCQAEAQAVDAPARRRILVVDDNVDSAESLAMMLKLSGNEVCTAHDGPSALEAAAAFAPDVVLLDIGMPGMDGYEVARRLRQMAALRKAVLIAQTGWGQEEDRRRSNQAGFDHHFTKPVDPSALQALLVSLESTEKPRGKT